MNQHAEARDARSFDACMRTMREAERELIVKHGVPVADVVRIVHEIHIASWNRGWDVAVRPMTPADKSS